MIEHSAHVRRRHSQPLPSRGKHAILAMSIFTFLIAGTVIATTFLGNAKDADVFGSVAVAAIPLPPPSDSLNGTSEALPDLLEGEVPDNANPTVAIDALGNAIEPTTIKVTPSSSSVPTRSGPQTIMIDGAPIGGNTSPLVPAPISGLSKASAYGRVPAVNASGISPLSAYKRPYSLPAGKKSVSIIIGGLGVNRTLTAQAINELPSDVTLAFAAHATGLQNWINQARAKGHEVLIELPMESSNFNASEPGADRALMVSRNVAANTRNLDWLLSRGQGYFGVTNYNGDVFLKRTDIAAPILDKLARSGLGFIFDGSVIAPTLPALSASASLPYAQAFNLIDTLPESDMISSKLSHLSDYANQGSAPIGVGFAYPETISTVKKWAETLDGQDLVLAPASSTLK